MVYYKWSVWSLEFLGINLPKARYRQRGSLSRFSYPHLTNVIVYSYQMCMRATISLSAPKQELLHKGVSALLVFVLR